MKVINTSDKEYFKPLSIEITFESEFEALNFYSIFNHPEIMAAARFGGKGYRIRRTMDLEVSDQRHSEFVDRVKERINK